MILSPYPLKCRPLYCRRYVDYIFVLFKLLVYLKRSQSYLNFCCVNMLKLSRATNIIPGCQHYFKKMVTQKTSLIDVLSSS